MNHALAKKLFLKSGYRVLVYQAPAGFTSLLPTDVHIETLPQGKYEAIFLFVSHSKELKKALPELIPCLSKETIFWICYPKKSSGVSTDLSMMQPWDELKQYNLSPVAAAAIDETWTGLRFRFQDEIKTKSPAAENPEMSTLIDQDKRTVKLPNDLEEALQPFANAMAFFQNLSFTNKKEYVVWIISAKQTATRQDRVRKSVEKLQAEKKNPAEK